MSTVIDAHVFGHAQNQKRIGDYAPIATALVAVPLKNRYYSDIVRG